MSDNGNALKLKGIEHGTERFHSKYPKIDDGTMVHPFTHPTSWPVDCDDAPPQKFGHERGERKNITSIAGNNQDRFSRTDLGDTNPNTEARQVNEACAGFQTIESEQLLLSIPGSNHTRVILFERQYMILIHCVSPLPGRSTQRIMVCVEQPSLLIGIGLIPWKTPNEFFQSKRGITPIGTLASPAFCRDKGWMRRWVGAWCLSLCMAIPSGFDADPLEQLTRRRTSTRPNTSHLRTLSLL
jgi:hypothetical protein